MKTLILCFSGLACGSGVALLMSMEAPGVGILAAGLAVFLLATRIE